MSATDVAQRAAEIVKDALEREPAEWPAFLDRACDGDTAVRAEAESLLNFQPQASDFIEQPAVHMAAQLLAGNASLAPGVRVLQYRIESLIGAGGMGEVYLATDTDLKRQVALKLVQRGMNTQEILRRFRHEEEILAGLNHPNIAQLYGSGVTVDGTPFFAMEYVDGARLDNYAHQRALSVPERLQLFRKICSAVAYAHQRLVIHRDLKPANIRVTNDGEPKLLDFGIAKLLDTSAQAPDATMTLPGMMTPEYASPEQVRGEAITTASDVYSLGVVLYELLTGQKPYRLTSRRPDEVARAITEQAPERPSTAIARSEQSQIEIRRSKILRGDIDNIVLMAVRKEPERRYASVALFSDDIRRHLEGRTVLARKDTFAYRSSRFIRRNRIAVAAAAVVVAALVSGLALALSSAKRAREQRDLAQRERSRAEHINSFLQRMLSFSNQSITSVSPVAQKRDVTVNAMLDAITPQVETELADQPEVRAQVLRTIGSAYASQGQYEAARKHLRAALETQLRLHGEENAEAVATMAELGVLSYRMFELEESNRLLEKAVAFHRREQETKSRTYSPAKLAAAMDHLAVVKFYRGDANTALSLFNEGLQIAAHLEGHERAVGASIKTNLGAVFVTRGEIERGEPLLRESLAEFREIFTEPRWEVGVTQMFLGIVATARNQPEEAGRLLEESEATLRAALGDSNGYLATNLDRQAANLFRKGDLARAEEKARASLDMRLSESPNARVFRAQPLITLGDIVAQVGRAAEAEQHYREAMAIHQEQATGNAQAIVHAQLGISKALLAQGRVAEARSFALQAQQTARERFGAQNVFSQPIADHLARIDDAENSGVAR